MNTKLRFSIVSAAFCCLMSSDIMALTLPGFGGGSQTTTTSQEVLILTCRNNLSNTVSSGESSCSSSGSTGSTCSSGSTTSTLSSSVLNWETTSTDQDLHEKLNSAGNCSEAVKAVGASDCQPSGGNEYTIYTCSVQ